MDNTKNELARILADNIAYYRKKMALTQLELAEKLNYSDKSISKWERAEGVPDIYVIKALSSFFGITVDGLLSKRKKPFLLFRHRFVIAYFYASIVWLIGGITYGVFSILQIDYPAWHLLIFSIPISTLIILCFYLVWRNIAWIYIYLSIFIWSLALSVKLLIDSPNDHWIFIITIPIYLFLLFLFFIIYKPKKIK